MGVCLDRANSYATPALDNNKLKDKKASISMFLSKGNTAESQNITKSMAKQKKTLRITLDLREFYFFLGANMCRSFSSSCKTPTLCNGSDTLATDDLWKSEVEACAKTEHASEF